MVNPDALGAAPDGAEGLGGAGFPGGINCEEGTDDGPGSVDAEVPDNDGRFGANADGGWNERAGRWNC